MATGIGPLQFEHKFEEIQNWIEDMEKRTPLSEFDPFNISLTDLRQRLKEHEEFMRDIKFQGESCEYSSS